MSELLEGEAFPIQDIDFSGQELRAFFQEVQEYEVLMNSIEVTDEEKLEIMNALDAQWPYFGETLRVSGEVLMSADFQETEIVEGDRGRYNLDPAYVADQPVESHGFAILNRPILTPGKEPEAHWVIGHYVKFDPITEIQTMFHHDQRVVWGFAQHDMVAIEYPTDSNAAVVEKMDYFYPQVAKQIELAMLNAADESSAVMSLAGIRVAVGKHDTIPELQSIAKYANNLVEFDKRMPYRFGFEGICFTVQKDGAGGERLIPSETVSGNDTYGRPLYIELISEPTVTDEGYVIDCNSMIFALRMEAYEPDREDKDDGQTYSIPIADAFYMRETRSFLYGLQNMSDRALFAE